MNKELKKIVNNHLDNIPKHLKKLAKAYKVDRLPMKLVYMVIDEAKVKHTSDKTVNDFITKYNDMLKSVKSILKKVSDKIGDDKISLLEVKVIIKHVKLSFNAV